MILGFKGQGLGCSTLVTLSDVILTNEVRKNPSSMSCEGALGFFASLRVTSRL
jgi:hypothetical protein